uniref:Uncharacterized protein n=1 Tax=Leersia perrieri TaxID=77586 RepID=A0A0D9VQJ3_9ORYZ
MAGQSSQPIRCKAAVCRAAGEPLVIEEIVVDPPKAHEVRIKIVCTSLCHSDVTFWRMQVGLSRPFSLCVPPSIDRSDGPSRPKWDFPAVFPRIFGHEAFGVVESVGEHVEDLATGDAVVPTFLGQCTECVDCGSDRSNVCSKYRFAVRAGLPRDVDGTRFHDRHGAPLSHFLGVSSFSEYTVVDATQVVRVDHAVPPASACLLSCGATTGVGAAWKLAKVEPGSSVAIFGLGAVGLALKGPGFAGRKKFGVTHFINPQELGEKSVSEAIIEITDGGADYCFECIGLASLMNDAFRSSREGWGKTIILGVEMHGAPLSIPSHEILHGKCVMGSLFGGVKPKQDIPILAQKYLNRELELDKFITHEVTLKDINTAFDLLLQGKSLRCTIWMDNLAHLRSQHRHGPRILAQIAEQHLKKCAIRTNKMQQSRQDAVDQQVAELRGELRKARQERDRANRGLEVSEWKALASANDRTTIETLEAELDASRESEKRMLESLGMQTKQLEMTKIELEEARIEIASLHDAVHRLEAIAAAAVPAAATATATTPRGGRYERDYQRVRGELRMALVAEEKNKKAMEELVLALKEVNGELRATRQQLARSQHEAETARLESDRLHVSLKRKDDKLRALSDEVARLRADAEDSFAAWRGKESGFTSCMRSTEAELADTRRENARLLESQRSGRDEIAKLRDILKQAVKDTKVVKEALEEARGENAMLRETLGDKDTAVKCTKQELECLRVTEAAARDSVKELQSLLVATSSSPTAAAAGMKLATSSSSPIAAGIKLEMEDSPSPNVSTELPGLMKSYSEARVKPPAGLTLPRRRSDNFEGSVYDIFGSMEDQKGDLRVFSTIPRSLPARRRLTMRKVGSLFRWKSFSIK